MEYEFNKKICAQCPRKDECLGKNKNRGKRYSITILSDIHTKQKEFEKTEYFNNTIKNERYKIEAKNAETKVTRELCKAKSMGLSCMRVQSYLTHITTNLKRIIKKMDEVPA